MDATFVIPILLASEGHLPSVNKIDQALQALTDDGGTYVTTSDENLSIVTTCTGNEPAIQRIADAVNDLWRHDRLRARHRKGMVPTAPEHQPIVITPAIQAKLDELFGPRT